MEEWRLIDLGFAEPLIAQAFYEAVAIAIDRGLSQNTIILVQPSSPYVCVGYHQRIKDEVDIEYCEKKKLPIIRRGQGGGTCYLDSSQIFYQIIANEESEVIPKSVEELFEKMLKATVYVYRKLGIPAEYKPINDVVVEGRKISGNGAGRIGKAIILVGNIILDLDYDSMCRVLKVPDEKFRDKIAKSMREWVSSIKKELGYIPPTEKIKELLKEAYEKTLNVKLTTSRPTEEEWKIFYEEVRPRHESKEWLYMPETKHEWLSRTVKIADGIRIVKANYKAKKMIKITAELLENKIIDISISGDFFAIPEEAVSKLEKMLTGVKIERKKISEVIKRFYDETKVKVVGASPEDFVEAIMRIRNEIERYLSTIKPF